MNVRDAPTVAWRVVGSIRLGVDSAAIPASTNIVKVTDNRIFVYDAGAHLLRAYDRAGNAKFILETAVFRAAALRPPISLAASGDTLFALAIDARTGVAVVDPSGRVTRRVPLQTDAATVDLSLADGMWAVATVTPPRAVDSRHGIVRVFDRDGKLRASGCSADSIYALSDRRGGLLGMFRSARVTTSGAHLYCLQAVTPFVQVLRADGSASGSVRVVPPFYRTARDQTGSMNQVTVNRFRASWWEHKRFYPTATGFTSVYESHDSVSGAERYRTFSCDSLGATRRCFTAELPGQPVDFLPPDTLFVVEPVTKKGATRRLSMLVPPAAASSGEKRHD